MTRKEALTELLDKVEAGETRVQIEEAAFRVWPDGHDHFKAKIAPAAFAESLDAAKALHEAVLPRHYAQVHTWPVPEMCRVDIGGGHTGRDDKPARAWLIAILKALIAQEQEA